MEWIYQIKIAQGEFSFEKPVAVRGIVEAESKKEVIAYLEKEYPEYFDGNKVSQKLSKKSEQVVFVTIFELDEYWDSYWNQEIECSVCHKKVPLIQIKNHVGNVNDWICSVNCEVKREEEKANEVGEYWNEQCAYYFIYKITNKLNGMVYIGYTEREPVFRWWEHFKHSHLPIGMALKEHGIESFTFEVLEKHLKTEKTVADMHDLESKYMNHYDSIHNGYNCMVSKKQDFDYYKKIG